MNKIKILIADDVKETRDVIKKILKLEKEKFDVVGEGADGEEVIALIPKLNPDIVLMDINMPILNGLEATERITDMYPNVIVIIMSVQEESEYLKRAMFVGAKEYIIKPLNYDSLIHTLRTTYEKQKERVISQADHSNVNKTAKIFTFFSSKGGVGKTILTLNTGAVFATGFQKKTLIIDMDLLFGDMAILVNQHRYKTIMDMIDEGQTDSFENMKPYLFSLNEKLDILLAPRSPESAEYIGKEIVKKIINIYRRHYEVIVIDTGVNFSDVTLYLLDIADQILFTTTMEMSGLKNTKLGLEVLETLHYSDKKVKVVINEVSGKYGVTEKDVQDVFKDSIFARIPEDIKKIRLSVNQGKPYCIQRSMKNTRFSKAIWNMCKQLIELE